MPKPTRPTNANWLVEDNKLVIQKNEMLTIGWWILEYSKTPRDARRMIARLLKNGLYGVNSTPTDLTSIKKTIGNAPTKDLTNEAAFTGIVNALCMEGDSSGSDTGLNYGPIKIGCPVTLDTISGCALTGINQYWLPDEYMILGTAMRDGSGFPDAQDVPVLLHKQHDKTWTHVARLLEDISGNAPGWARIIEQPSTHGWPTAPFGPPGENPRDVKVYNLPGYLSALDSSTSTGINYHASLYKYSLVCITYEGNGRWIVVAAPFKKPFIRGILKEDLPFGGAALCEILASTPGSSDKTAIATGLEEHVTNSYMPSQLILEEGTKFGAAWDHESQFYVVVSIDETDFYKSLIDRLDLLEEWKVQMEEA